MSDHDPAPDPIDKAYVRAEDLLDDEAARAARRARVLGAVARETETPSPADRPVPRPQPQPLWRRGGWLAAAGVAGVTALLGLRLYPQFEIRQEPPPPPVAAAPAPQAEDAPASAAPGIERAAPQTAPRRAEPAAPRQAAAPAESAPPAPGLAPPALQIAPAAPPPPAPPPPPPPPPPAPAAAMRESQDEVVVTGSRMQASPFGGPEALKTSPASGGAARLTAAAAAGRVDELRTLLRQGTDVDALDAEGETALMRSVRANQPAAAALLRRRGASLDLKNPDGMSARDMAAAIGDPALNRALGLAP